MRSLILFLAIVSFGCSKNGGGSSSPPSEAAQLSGKTYSSIYTLTNGDTVFLTASFQDQSNVTKLYARQPLGKGDIYYDRSVGTYTISGGQISLQYSYESCDPISQESFAIGFSNPMDAIEVTENSTTLVLKYEPNSDSMSALSGYALIEDRSANCLETNPQPTPTPVMAANSR